MKFDSNLTDCVQTDIAIGKPVMLMGEPGIGKSSWVENLARVIHAQYFCLPCNQLATKEDLTGARLVPVEHEDGSVDYVQMFYPHATVQQAITAAVKNPDKKIVLFLDELNRTTSDVTSALLSLSTNRTIGSQQVPDNIIIISAGNDRGNVTPLDEASKSRFAIYHVAPDIDTYLTLDPQLNPYVKKTLEDDPNLLFCKQIAEQTDADEDEVQSYDGLPLDDILDDDGQDQLTTPRTITGISNWLNYQTDQQLIQWISETTQTQYGEISVLQEMLEAHTGHTAFTLALLKNITDGVSKPKHNAAPSTLIAKPVDFDKLFSLGTYSELESQLRAKSPDELSHILLWALTDDRDCSDIINITDHIIETFTADDSRTLMSLFVNNQYNRKNLSCFVDGDSDMSTTYKAFLIL